MIPPRARAALLLRAFLTESLGDPVDVELFRGFLAAAGAALLRGGAALVCDPPDASDLLVVELACAPPLVVPLVPAEHLTDLDTGLSAVLAACARVHRVCGGGAPPLADLLEDLARAAGNRVRDLEGGPLRLRAITVHPADAEKDDAKAEADWDGVAAVLMVVGRLQMPELAVVADLVADLVADTVGASRYPDLPDPERRALLALADAAARRARGDAPARPAHPDPHVEVPRARLVADAERLLDREKSIDPDNTAEVLATLTRRVETGLPPPGRTGAVMAAAAPGRG